MLSGVSDVLSILASSSNGATRSISWAKKEHATLRGSGLQVNPTASGRHRELGAVASAQAKESRADLAYQIACVLSLCYSFFLVVASQFASVDTIPNA